MNTYAFMNKTFILILLGFLLNTTSIFSQEISEKNKKNINQFAFETARNFEKSLSVAVRNKKNKMLYRNETKGIESLFESNKNKIYVLNKKDSVPRSYTIKRYLKTIRKLPYYQIEIDFFNEIMIDSSNVYNSKIKIQSCQVFKGSNSNGEVQYTDTVVKIFTIDIHFKINDFGAYTDTVNIINLGDIRVRAIDAQNSNNIKNKRQLLNRQHLNAKNILT